MYKLFEIIFSFLISLATMTRVASIGALLSFSICISSGTRLAFAHQGHHHNDAHNHHHDTDSFPSFLSDRNLNNLQEIQRCGTHEPSKEELIKIDAKLQQYSKTINKQYLKAAMEESIEINVYWNTLTSSNGEGALSDDVIAKQIQVLNDAYSGNPSSYDACGFTYDNSTVSHTPFVFNLVEINVFEDNNAYIIDNFQDPKRRELHQGNCSDLNIYSGRSDAGFLGYAKFPWDCAENLLDDGVVVEYSSLPDQDFIPYNEGDSLVHEVGHWLGLFHTFQGGCLDRDYVIDTPAQHAPTFGCPVDEGKNTCGSPGSDLIYNFMDYSDDCCMYSFTDGQNERMILHAGLFRGLSANVTLPTVLPLSCSFPDDGFNYSQCDVQDLCWIGDGYCDADLLAGYDTDECNNDGGDCACEFPDDGFNYSSCNVEKPCWIGNGWCDSYYEEDYLSDECNNDAGDCFTCEYPNDGFDYSSCNAPPCWISDGFCDTPWGTPECNNDGGDCGLISIIAQAFFTILLVPYQFLITALLLLYCFSPGLFNLCPGLVSNFFPFAA